MKFYRGYNQLSEEDINNILLNGDRDVSKGFLFVPPKISQHSYSAEQSYGFFIANYSDYLQENERNQVESWKVGTANWCVLKGMNYFGKCITGSFLTASFYSYMKQNKANSGFDGKLNNKVAVLDLDLDKIIIDGRDFLYKFFYRLINSKNNSLSKSTYTKLAAAYGDKFIDYLDIFLKNDWNKLELTGFVDYIVCDKSIIDSHYNSKILLNGSMGASFQNQFVVRGGISPEEVIEVIDEKYVDTNSLSANILEKEYRIIDTLSLYEI
jgi:hypothetical protein